MPLVIWDIESVEKKQFQAIAQLEMDGECYLPIKFLYTCSSPRIFIGIDEHKDDSDEQLSDFISFDWTNEITTDRILKTMNNEQVHLVVSLSF